MAMVFAGGAVAGSGAMVKRHRKSGVGFKSNGNDATDTGTELHGDTPPDLVDEEDVEAVRALIRSAPKTMGVRNRRQKKAAPPPHRSGGQGVMVPSQVKDRNSRSLPS